MKPCWRRTVGQWTLVVLGVFSPTLLAQDGVQSVEGFAKVEFHHNANRSAATLDFRGMSAGYMTAGWWAVGQMTKML